MRSLRWMKHALAALPLLAIWSCAANSRGSVDSVTPRDATVYRAALDSIATPGKTIILVDSTGFLNSAIIDLGSDLRYAKLPEETVQRFLQLNQRSLHLDGGSFAGRPVRLIAFRDLPFSSPLSDDNWSRFGALYPDADGFYRVSRIAYNRDGKTAVVHVENGCGSLCGAGKIVILRAGQRGWSVVQVFETWNA